MKTTQAKPKVRADVATAELREALAMAGITMPSLGIENASPNLELVALGCIRVDVALKLAEVIRNGSLV